MAKLLDERLIILDADISSSEDAARLMGARLEELATSRRGYADMVIEREKTFPTGLPGKTMGDCLAAHEPHVGEQAAIGSDRSPRLGEVQDDGRPGNGARCRAHHAAESSRIPITS